MRYLLLALLIISPFTFADGLPVRNLSGWYLTEDGLFVRDNRNNTHRIELSCPYEPKEVKDISVNQIRLNKDDKITLLASSYTSSCEIKSITADS